PVTAENRANKTAGLEEANHSAGTQDKTIAGNSEMVGDSTSAVQTRSKVNKSFGSHAFKIFDALEDESWVDTMQEELL
ncbi:hypothetical protein Tco_0186854, partial [Tanacetum coccineum]